jgi:hypothetical protein
MIYKAGHKYIDLERVTAIEPIMNPGGPLEIEGLPAFQIPPYIMGANIHCQLHEHPIEIYFPQDDIIGEKTREQQFDDLMAAWRSVVEKRNPQHHPKIDPLPAQPATCPSCHTFHNSNETCPGK